MRTSIVGGAVCCLLLALGCSSHRRDQAGGVTDGGLDASATGDGDGSENGTNSGAGGHGSGTTSGHGASSGSGADADASAMNDSDAASFGDGGLGLSPSELCGGACVCSDGIDNDGDGAIDGFDVECTGPADNDEGTFATGIPGDNRDPKWQDCFFDGNSGGGDDGCRYSTKCLTGELDADDKDCRASQDCIDFCTARTPNGCDCFGCCTFTLPDGDELSVMLQASCSTEHLDQCTACVPAVNGCSNECGRCELCPGKTAADLPEDCGPPPPTAGSGGSGGAGGTDGESGRGGSGGTGEDPPPPNYTCDNGEQVCFDSGDCPGGYYCSFGCCLIAVL